MKVILKPAPSTPRKAYSLSEDEKTKYLKFIKGIRVLPAEHYETNSNIQFWYIERHEHGEHHWDGGGHECYDSTGAKRAFYLDALIVHPDEIKDGGDVSVVVEGAKRRGRKRIHEKVIIDPNKPKGKRGRPPLDPELKKQREMEAELKPTTGKRGRPRVADELKKTKSYVPTGGKRGRPSVPDELKKTKPYVPKGGKRGRPAKAKPATEVEAVEVVTD